MDATTEHPSLGAPRLVLRGGSLALALGLLASCGGAEDDPGATAGSTTTTTTSDAATSDAATSSAATSEAVVLVIVDFAYEVPDTVPPGAEITIRNEDSVGHTVTSDDETTFDVAVGPGEEVTMTAPEEAGEFPFFCRPHPDMRATLVVGEG